MTQSFATNPRQAAMTEARELLTQAVNTAMEKGLLPAAELPEFIVEVPADVKNGDIASNLALAGARAFKTAPRKIAEAIVECLPTLEGSLFQRVEIAGPGFINLFLSDVYFADIVRAAASRDDFGRTDFGQGKKINVEFVSANPTGPMHLGNARGGALGDCLAAVLDWAGYDVTREFLINDAGNQILKFGKSLAARYRQHFLGEEAVPFPEDGYQGEDIKLRASQFAQEVGDKYLNASDEELQKAITAFALPKNVQGLKDDLGKYRIQYDVWFSETTLHESGAVKAVVDKLTEMGATYEKDGAIWYRSTKYSAKYGVNKKKTADGEEEEKDEVLVRANGIPTYFAADIAYHYNKFAVRGFDRVINVWGADHHGHVARLKGAMDAIGLDGSKLDIILMQLVRLMRDGQPVKMSKRSGKSITLTNLIEEVPVDAARFFFNVREPNTTLDFDLDLAVEQSSSNPVYYVQYAHARICSILKNLAAEGITPAQCSDAQLALLNSSEERELIRLLARYPGEIIDAAKFYDPARITRYTQDLATLFHKFYNACRVKGESEDLMQARLSLCVAARTTLHNALTLLKITAPESM